MKSMQSIVVEGRKHNLVSASIDDANMSNAVVMFPRFLVLSTSNS
jgi:hypothetical protein